MSQSEERQHDNINENFSKSDEVSDGNKEAVREFCRELAVQDVSKRRRAKYVSNWHTILRKFAPEDFDIRTASRDELKLIVGRINDSGYAETTKADFKLAIKYWYKVVLGELDTEKYPDRVQFISTTADSDDADKFILSQRKILELIEECHNDRDRAMLKLLYEGGLRPGELMALQIEDIKFTEKGVRVNIPPVKTGSRSILVVESERYLKNWLQKHPHKDKDQAPLWMKIEQTENEHYKDSQLSYDSMRQLLKRNANRCDIGTYMDWARNPDGSKKIDGDEYPKRVERTKVIPYTFRHSRATHLAVDMSEAAMKQYFGWTQDSDMPRVYIHLSGRDIDSEILDYYGIEIEEDEEDKGKNCPRCGRFYEGVEDFCPKCGSPFDFQTATDHTELEESGERVLDERVSGMDDDELMDRLDLLRKEMEDRVSS